MNKKNILLLSVGIRALIGMMIIVLLGSYYGFSMVVLNTHDQITNQAPWFNQTATLADIEAALQSGKYNVNQYYNGRTGLMWAMAWPGERALGMANLLLQYGANPNLKEDLPEPGSPMPSYLPEDKPVELAFGGNTALHIACFMGDLPDAVARIALLLKYGANPNIKNGNDDIPLQTLRDVSPTKLFSPDLTASATTLGVIIRMLVEAGSDINTRNRTFGFTFLHMAVERNNFPLTQFIKDLYGSIIDFTVKDNDGRTPEELAEFRGFRDLADVLHILPPIIGQANVNERDAFKRTGLMLAILANKLTLAQQLLANSIDIEAEDDKGYRALHYAVMHRTEPATFVNLVLGYKPTLDVKTVNGDTPLHFAADIDDALMRDQVTRALIKAGANILIQNVDGELPLHIAVRNNYTNIIPLLKNQIAVGIRNNEQLTAQEVAERLRHLDAIAALNTSQ